MLTSPSDFVEMHISICAYCEEPFRTSGPDLRRRYCSTQCGDDVQRRRSKKSVMRQKERADIKWRAMWLTKVWTKGKAVCKQT